MLPFCYVIQFVIVLADFPLSARPIIGHFHLLVASKNLPHLIFGTMADKYGPVFSIRLGFKRAVVVSGREMAKECFTTDDLALAFVRDYPEHSKDICTPMQHNSITSATNADSALTRVTCLVLCPLPSGIFYLVYIRLCSLHFVLSIH